MRQNRKLYNLMVSTLFVTINIVLASISYNLKLPLFMDTLGTMLGTRFFGWKYGVLIAVAGSVVNSFYDAYAIPYLPTYLATVVMIAVVYNNKKLKKLPLPIKAILVTIPSATIGGFITAYLFGGITSSGTSVVVSMLTKMGFTLFQSSLIVQLVFEYLDKVIMMLIMETVIDFLPDRVLEKIPKRLK